MAWSVSAWAGSDDTADSTRISRPSFKPDWDICRTSITPPPPPQNFANLEEFASAVLTPDRQIPAAEAADLASLTRLPDSILARFALSSGTIQEVVDWLLNGDALRHPSPSIFGFLRQLLVPRTLSNRQLTENEIKRVNWLASALSVFRESEHLLEESGGSLQRHHMELEHHIPALSAQQVDAMARSTQFERMLSISHNELYRSHKAAMIRWMQSYGMDLQRIERFFISNRSWGRIQPDVDLAVHNPRYRGASDLRAGIKPFLKVLQLKTHLVSRKLSEPEFAHRINEILDKNLQPKQVGQLALFPSDLAEERIFVIELRGVEGERLERAVRQMSSRLQEKARATRIIYQINGDDGTAFIRPQ